MSEFFLNIVNMSISASWIVIAVLLLRILLKKAPKWITVLLWGIVAIRLICPFSIESVMSLIPSAETISPEIMMDRTPEINSGVPIINNIVNPIIGESFTPDPATSANPLQLWIPTFAVVWLTGIVGLLLYTIISYIRVKRKIGTAILLRNNIFQSENVISPFVLGIIKPKIYLPFKINEQNMEHVIAHEQAHIRRKDHWWKPLGFLVLTIHWFNPLMWLGYILLCRDIEIACDEKVIKELNVEQKADYSQALLTCSVNRRVIAACPLAFGEIGVKNRVKSVLNYKKPAFWIIVVAIIASVVAAVCFLTNPINISVKVLNKLINLEDYGVVEQDEKNITLSIPVSELSDSIYTESGKKFSQKEIIAYQDATTSIYLKEARYSNEGKDNLYFCFDFAFELPKKQGVLLYPYEITNSGLSGSVRTVDGILRADNGEFADAIADRGQGSNNLIWFYVSTDALKQAQGTIRFDVELNQIAYWLDGDEYSSISNIGGVDNPSEIETTIDGYPFFFAEVLEIYDNSILVKATKDAKLIKANLEYSVSTNMINDSIPFPDIEVGTNIAIIYNGEIQETYPAQINFVYAIYNVTEVSPAILPTLIFEAGTNNTIIDDPTATVENIEKAGAVTAIMKENTWLHTDNKLQNSMFIIPHGKAVTVIETDTENLSAMITYAGYTGWVKSSMLDIA